ncbi:hypothetical protein [Butyrivibrio sp. LB2008]|uniref:hypothetical protein n=1 Tax=Butyrivibrio sp. LB2008 TaxID=1408305 RepID=UPI0012DEC9F8|nr:hypothetical protein [Butyrivibrio sp. LB2008]
MKKKIATYLIIISMISTVCGCYNSNAQTITESNSENSTTAGTENASTYVSLPDNIQSTEYAEPGSEHSFYGWYSDEYFLMDENSLIIWPQIDRSADNIKYSDDLTVEITKKQKQYIIDHFYDEFKITYTFEEDMKPPISRVKATKIEVVSDKEAVGELTDAGSDPLKNLVADDILTSFRAMRPVKNKDSIYEEGYVLGRWVMKTIGKENFSEEIKEKGCHIGDSNEYWFGADISNNFSGNFASMYGTYYALKDYYTSDGKNSTEFYNELLVNCWDENISEKPEIIKSLYDDLQEFVSECNNLIRQK